MYSFLCAGASFLKVRIIAAIVLCFIICLLFLLYIAKICTIQLTDLNKIVIFGKTVNIFVKKEVDKMTEEKLQRMKEACGLTCTEISVISGIPEPTVRKVISGKTPDPRYETISKIVEAMGYTMNDLSKEDGKKDDVKILYENRLRELHTNYAGYIKSLKRDKMILAIAIAAVLTFVFVALIIDILYGDIGWIRH